MSSPGGDGFMNESMGGSTQMIWEHNKKKRCSQCGKRFCRGAWCEMCQERHCFDCGSCVEDPESDNLYSEGHTMQYTRRCDEGHPFTFSTPNWWSGCDTCHEWLYDTGIRIGQCNDSNHRHPETDTFREPHGLLHGHLSLEEMNNKLNNNNDHPVRLLMHKALTSSGRKSAPSDCRHNHTCIIHCTELTAISSRTNVYIKVISAIFPLAQFYQFPRTPTQQ